MHHLFKVLSVLLLASFHTAAWCQSTTIGPAGGKLISADGQLTIQVPPGAIEKPTGISIRAQRNSNPGGLGQEYELLPHSIWFRKPVQLEFGYRSWLDSIVFPCGLQIAFTDSTNKWKIKAGRQHNQQQHTLTVTTDHFSKWCVMESVKLSPQKADVQPSGTVAFKVTDFVPADLDPCAPVLKDIPVGSGQLLPAERIKKWTLVSSFGSLVPSGSTAIYKAPSTPAPKNSITVMVELKSQPMPLLAKVEVIDASFGVVIQFGQDPPVVYDRVEATKDGDSYHIQVFDQQGVSLGYITFEGRLPGIFNWTGNGSPGNNHFSFIPPSLKRWTFESYYEKNGKALDSFGFITAKREGNARELLTGEFSIKNAGKINVIDGDGTYEGETTVEGRFKVVLQQDK